MVEVNAAEDKQDMNGSIGSDEMDLSSGLADEDIMNDVEDADKHGHGEEEDELSQSLRLVAENDKKKELFPI